MEIEEKIKKIEKEIRETPYHKGTEHHIGRLRAKMAKLRDQLLMPKKKAKALGFAIKKEGDATVVLLGFPSVGKSTLLNKLTEAKSKVADYDFTTLTVIPGVLKFNGAKIQILDLPGIINQAAKGRGWGRQTLSAVRVADLLLILIEATKLDQVRIIQKELYQAGVRINEERPAVLIRKKSKGGIQVASPTLSYLDKTQVIDLAQEFGLKNAEIIIKEDLTIGRLIDAFSQNRAYVPAIFAINKIDLVKDLSSSKKKFPNHLLVSAKENIGLNQLREVIWKELNLMRIYLKPKDGQPDLHEPLILKKGATVYEAAGKVSQELVENLKGAQLFGVEAKYKGQKVSVNHKLNDGSILTLLD